MAKLKENWFKQEQVFGICLNSLNNAKNLFSLLLNSVALHLWGKFVWLYMASDWSMTGVGPSQAVSCSQL